MIEFKKLPLNYLKFRYLGYHLNLVEMRSHQIWVLVISNGVLYPSHVLTESGCFHVSLVVPLFHNSHHTVLLVSMSRALRSTTTTRAMMLICFIILTMWVVVVAAITDVKDWVSSVPSCQWWPVVRVTAN